MSDTSNSASIERTLTQDDFDNFAALSGDDNPIHVDPVFSARTRFGRTVSHGMLLASIVRGLIDRILPGATQLSQDLRFPAPTFAGEPMLFSVRVVGIEGNDVTVEFSCRRKDDDVLTCTGSSVLRQDAP